MNKIIVSIALLLTLAISIVAVLFSTGVINLPEKETTQVEENENNNNNNEVGLPNPDTGEGSISLNYEEMYNELLITHNELVENYDQVVLDNESLLDDIEEMTATANKGIPSRFDDIVMDLNGYNLFGVDYTEGASLKFMVDTVTATASVLFTDSDGTAILVTDYVQTAGGVGDKYIEFTNESNNRFRIIYIGNNEYLVEYANNGLSHIFDRTFVLVESLDGTINNDGTIIDGGVTIPDDDNVVVGGEGSVINP